MITELAIGNIGVLNGLDTNCLRKISTCVPKQGGKIRIELVSKTYVNALQWPSVTLRGL